jgi:CxxC motif-containing protein (DUF1111 family)
MKQSPEAKALVAVFFLSSAGCGTGVIGAPQPTPADIDPDDDTVSAMTAQKQAMQATYGQPFPNLRTEELERFDGGRAQFVTEEGPADGLGPVFNDVSCGKCHATPALGGGSTTLETRFGAITNGVFDPLTQFGGSLIQVKGIGLVGTCDYVGESVPPEANVVAQRRTVPLFGLGLVDSVPESTFHYVASIEAVLFPEQAGRVARVQDIARGRPAVGRFGWKDQETSLHQFSGDAYLNEMGVTNPEFPNENCPNGDCALLACNPRPDLNDDGSDVAAFTDFMTLLAPPPRAPPGPEAFDGKRVFSALGCSHCHWATFRTGSAAVAALSDATFHPYSDFLLHDMGSLGDGIALADAKGSEFRTAPLWGVSALTLFLHDGRATTLSEAILAHDGQAKSARDGFANLSVKEQSALVAFLNSL